LILGSLPSARGNYTCSEVREALPVGGGEIDGEESEEGHGTGASACLGCGCSPYFLNRRQKYTMGFSPASHSPFHLKGMELSPQSHLHSPKHHPY
jgi:hypothetical protein